MIKNTLRPRVQARSLERGRALFSLTSPPASITIVGQGMLTVHNQGRKLAKAGGKICGVTLAWAIWVLLLLLIPTQRVMAEESLGGAAGGQSQTASARGDAAELLAQKVRPKGVESCLVCNKAIGPEDVVYLVEGQRVPVHRGTCDAELRARPRTFLAKLKPRGAFLDASSLSAQASYGWLYLGLYVLAGLVFAALAAHRAFHVGRRPLAWLAVGLIGNLPGYLVLLALPKREVRALAGIPPGLGKIASTYSPQACPYCGAENHPSASECSGCAAKLNPTTESEAARIGLRSA